MNNSSSRLAYPILALGLLLTAVGAVASDAARGILNGEAMADRTAAALNDPRVSAFVADRLTNAVLAEKPDLVAFRPIIAATAGGLVETAPFRAIVRSAVRTAHRSAVSTTGQRVLLSLPDVGVLIQSAVQSMSPEMADKIPPRLESFASDLNQRPEMDKIRKGLRLLDFLSHLGRTLLLSGPVLIILGIWLARERRRALLRAGIGLLVAAVLLVAVLPAGRAMAAILSQEALERGAIAGLWRAYFRGLVAWGITLGGIGLLITAAATSLLEAVDPIRRAEQLFRSIATPPRTQGLILLWSLGMTLAGGLVVANPVDAAAAITLLAGLGLCYIGLRELFRLVLGALPEETAEVAALERQAGWPLVYPAGGGRFPPRPGTRWRRRRAGPARQAGTSGRTDGVQWVGPALRPSGGRGGIRRYAQFDVERGNAGVDVPAAERQHPAAAAGWHSRPADRRAQRRAGGRHRAHRPRSRGTVGHEDRERRGRFGDRRGDPDPEPPHRRAERSARALPVPWLLRDRQLPARARTGGDSRLHPGQPRGSAGDGHRGLRASRNHRRRLREDRPGAIRVSRADGAAPADTARADRGGHRH